MIVCSGVSEDGVSYCEAQLTFCDGSAETNQSTVVSGVVEEVADEGDVAGELNFTRNRLTAVDVVKRALNQGYAFLTAFCVLMFVYC